jgi:predicted NAD/FAD-dependent oxidoreductase
MTHVIIGAGLSGLTLGRRLSGRGSSVVVVEKSRGPGGRIATRREADTRFDHGAQFFTVRSSEFQAEVAQWLGSGVVARWEPRLVDLSPSGMIPRASEHPRYVGTPGMSAIGKHLSSGLDVRPQLRATALARPGGAGTPWTVTLAHDDGSHATSTLTADRITLATPREQAIALLDTSGERLPLPQVATVPCWAVMLAYADSLGLPFDAAKVSGSPLAWIARDNSKPARPGPLPETWVLHASPDWSQANLERPAEEVAGLLTSAFTSAIALAAPTPPAPTHLKAHRWRYAQTPDSPATPPSPFALSPDNSLSACGDYFAGGKIEAAFLSAAGLAERLGGLS